MRARAVAPEKLQVELAFALPDEQMLVVLEMGAGATVADAMAQSDIAGRFPQHDFGALQAGIWGRPVRREHLLGDGDRVELYRPLQRDPRDARRDLASAGMTMRGAEEN